MLLDRLSAVVAARDLVAHSLWASTIHYRRCQCGSNAHLRTHALPVSPSLRLPLRFAQQRLQSCPLRLQPLLHCQILPYRDLLKLLVQLRKLGGVQAELGTVASITKLRLRLVALVFSYLARDLILIARLGKITQLLTRTALRERDMNCSPQFVAIVPIAPPM